MEIKLSGLLIRIDETRVTLPLYPTPARVPALRGGELRNANGLWDRMRQKRDPLSAYLYSRLDANARQQLEAIGDEELPESLAEILAQEVSRLIEQEERLYAPQRFEHLYLGDELLEMVRRPVPVEKRAYVNRLLLEAAYGEEISRRTIVGHSLQSFPPLFHPTVAPAHIRLTLIPDPEGDRQQLLKFSVKGTEKLRKNDSRQRYDSRYDSRAEEQNTDGQIAKREAAKRSGEAQQGEDPSYAEQAGQIRDTGEWAWNPKWAYWTFFRRSFNAAVDGGVTEALNRTLNQGRELQIEVQPSDVEGRTVMLNFACELDMRTRPGDFDFTVTIQEEGEGGESVSFDGTLCLRHPESRFLAMLPNLYRRELVPDMGADGEYREMAIFARFIYGIEESAEATWQLLGRLYQYFGPFSTSSEFLAWLASWIGLVLNENWPEMKRRQLLRKAVDLYTRRGTPRGLADYLEIYTGVRPTILDLPHAGEFYLTPHTYLGHGTYLGKSRSHTFKVIFDADKLATIDPVHRPDEHVVRQIINAEKPAHTEYELFPNPFPTNR